MIETYLLGFNYLMIVWSNCKPTPWVFHYKIKNYLQTIQRQRQYLHKIKNYEPARVFKDNSI